MSLERVYGQGRARTLRQSLLDLTQHAAVGPALLQSLLQAGDPPEYARLLHEAFAVLPAGDPQLPPLARVRALPRARASSAARTKATR